MLHICVHVSCCCLLAVQLADVQEVLSSQCGSAHTILVRAVQGDLPPGAVAATVLITTPAPVTLMMEAPEDGSAANQSVDGSAAAKSGNGTVRNLADMADTADSDTPDAAGDEDQQQHDHEEVPPGQDLPFEGNPS
jgi:hypothetical protein